MSKTDISAAPLKPHLDRTAFRAHFGGTGPVVLPVIHVLDTARTCKNIEIAGKAGAPGCFLINHDFAIPPFLPIIRAVRAAFPDVWLGLNFLGLRGHCVSGNLAPKNHVLQTSQKWT